MSKARARWTPQHLAAFERRRAVVKQENQNRPIRAPDPPAPKSTKYRNRTTYVDGFRFQSKAEAVYYQRATLQMRAVGGYLLMQVPITLPGGITYRVDFLEVTPEPHALEPGAQRLRYVEVKGVLTPDARIKIRQARELYPVQLDVVRCVDYERGQFELMEV